MSKSKKVAINASRAVNMDAVRFLNHLRKDAVKKEIRATHAVEQLLEEMPELSRAETYKSAEVAGINPLTARNVYDRLH